MIILFPSNPINPKSVDESFGYEARAAKDAGFRIGRIDLEIILGGEVKLSGIEEEKGDIIYRGWLMKPEHYAKLNAAIPTRIVTDFYDYVRAYELPHWYAALGDKITPRTTVVLKDKLVVDDLPTIVEQSFNSGSVILKDFVKSAKHKWYDACFIRDASDGDEIKRIVKNFLNNQGDDLQGGLCFREFINFRQIGVHSKTRMPLINEYRAFMKHGKIFYTASYWAEGDYSGAKPDNAVIEKMSEPLKHLPFIAVDVAEKENGDWMVVEVNDGGAAGVPEGGNTFEFFKQLAKVYNPC